LKFAVIAIKSDLALYPNDNKAINLAEKMRSFEIKIQTLQNGLENFSDCGMGGQLYVLSENVLKVTMEWAIYKKSVGAEQKETCKLLKKIEQIIILTFFFHEKPIPASAGIKKKFMMTAEITSNLLAWSNLH
jgi:hypothetical protein